MVSVLNKLEIILKKKKQEKKKFRIKFSVIFKTNKIKYVIFIKVNF